MHERSHKILITGASGFVGSALVAQLLQRGHSVIAACRRKPRSARHETNLSWVCWDALLQPVPQVPWDQLHAVVHLASPDKPFSYPDQLSAMYEITVTAWLRILERARHSGVSRALLASTGSVFAKRTTPAGEEDAVEPCDDPYGTAKFCAEQICRGYEPYLSTAVLRLFHPYGSGGEHFLVNRMVHHVRNGLPVYVEGAEGVVISPVWIEDLSAGLCDAIASQATGVLHFAGPEVISLRHLLNVIGEKVRKKPLIETRSNGSACCLAGTAERSRRLLGYAPQVRPQDGIERLLREYAS